MTFNRSDCWSSNKHTITIAMSFVVPVKSSKDNKNPKLWLKNSKNYNWTNTITAFKAIMTNCSAKTLIKTDYQSKACVIGSSYFNWVNKQTPEILLCFRGFYQVQFIFLFFQFQLKTHIFLNWHQYGMMVQCSAINNKPFLVPCTCTIKRRLLAETKICKWESNFCWSCN